MVISYESMRFYIIITIVLIFFSSCNKRQLSDDELLLGDWQYDTTLVMKKTSKENVFRSLPPFSLAPEFEFLPNGNCHYKNGLFERGYGNKEGMSCYAKFKGTALKYNFKNSNLILKYLNDSLFLKYAVKKVTEDSLILIGSQNDLRFYSRVKPNTNRVIFDKIIVSTTGCFGSCRVATVVINKNGTVLMNNQNYTEDDGLFIGKISEKEFKAINDRFNKIDIASLKHDYSINASDGQSVSVQFIKDNKRYNTVNDYMEQAPPLLIQAYNPVIYLSQTIKTKNKITNPDFDFNNIGNFDFKDNHFYSLSHEQETELLIDLYKSKKTNVVFNRIYELNLYNKKYDEFKVYSDGRYFKFIKKDKSNVTYDLGYNFLKRYNMQPQKYL